MSQHGDIFPTLSSFDVKRVAQLIQQAYAPPTPATTPDDLRRLQQELFEIQKRPEAWGLVVPLMLHMDPNVQFFGAHTAQVKIACDWDVFPQHLAEALPNTILSLTLNVISVRCPKFVLCKLFVALTSLALKLVPGHPSQWQDWIFMCVKDLMGSPGHMLDFLSIAAEEVTSADLVGPSKSQMLQTMNDSTYLVADAINNTIAQPFNTTLQSKQLGLLVSGFNVDFTTLNDSIFIAASDALQELTTNSALADGSGSKMLTEPLLVWLDTTGSRIVESMLTAGEVSSISHLLCKFLGVLGDHSTTYITTNISLSSPVSTGPTTIPTTKGHLVQNLLKLLLVYTGLPGYYGIDEDESKMTLGFWYLFQEALWSTDFFIDSEGEDQSPAVPNTGEGGESQQVLMAKAVFCELVQTLRKKVAFPPSNSGWSRDQIDKFQVLVVFPHVGNTLINAYYVLRNDMLAYFMNDIIECLATRQEGDGWQEIEATLHCIMSIQEAIDMETIPEMKRVFSPEVLGRLPSTGRSRVRWTALGIIGTYSSWFATQELTNQAEPHLLMTVLTHVVSALPDPSLSLSAATVLRNLCDANRQALVVHIGSFGELYAGLSNIPNSEKSKVLQSISSVIQAMPPSEEIPAIEVGDSPVID